MMIDNLSGLGCMYSLVVVRGGGGAFMMLVIARLKGLHA